MSRFIKVKYWTLGKGLSDIIINIDNISSIHKIINPTGRIDYEIILSSHTIKIPEEDAQKIFDIIGISL